MDLDEKLLKEALKTTGIKKKTHLLEEALRVIIQKIKREKITKHFGKLKLSPSVLVRRHAR